MRLRLLIPIIVTFGVVCGTLTAEVNLHHMDTVLASSNAASFPVYPKNASGETYGSDAHATSLSTEPDLILATGTNGKNGYVRASDLFGQMPNTPEQAVALDTENQKARTIPLYASDGKTVIGAFLIGGGTVTSAPAHNKTN